MVRWEPGAAERLQRAALDLFTTQGFDGTTAAEIAETAGLTQRTFFRYFGDKRDVLFHGQDAFVARFVDAIAAAPPGAAPMQLVEVALRAAADWFPDERRPYSRARQAVIDGNPALLERERHKLAGLAVSVAAALRARGVTEPAGTLAAESAATVFGVAFARWIDADETRSLDVVVVDTLAELRALNT